MARTDRKELLIHWLNNAYATEKALIQVLDTQAKRAQEFPDVYSRLQGHLEQTQRQAEMVKGQIERIGGSVSKLKSGFMQVMAEVQSQAMGASKEVVVRDLIMTAASEKFEIANYQAIIKLAEEMNETELVKVCKEILKEEEEMSKWVDQQLPKTVDELLRRISG